MPLLRKGVVMPVKGIDFSVPSTFIDDQNAFPQNMRYYRGEMGKRPGKTIYGTAAQGGQIMGLGVLEDNNGLKYLVRTTKTKLERYNTTLQAWESISATNFTGDDEDFFSFATVSESGLLLVSNGKNLIRKWSGSGNAAALGGNPPKAKYMTYLTPYVLLAHIDDGAAINPWKVQWCGTGTPEVWTGGNSGADLLSREPSAIQNIANLNEFAAVYKEKSLWLGQKVSSSDVFQFSCIQTGIGLAAPRAFAEAEGRHFFMGHNDFYEWNGIRPTPIGGAVRDEVFSTIDRSKINRCFGLHVQELTEIWFFVVLSGETWPTVIWKYNYRTGFWYYDTCASLTAAAKWKKILSENWENEVGAWDDALDIWDAGDSIADWEEVIFGDKDGQTLKLDYTKADDNDVAVDAWLKTKTFVGDALEKSTRWLQIDVWARGSSGAKMYVDYSINDGATWVNIPYTSSQAYVELTEDALQYDFYFDIISSSRGIRFRVRNAESGELFFVRNFCPYYLSKEQNRMAR